MTGSRERLDITLVARGLAASRSRARDLIRLGQVRVSGNVARKAGDPVGADEPIEVAPDANPYVSRGGLKLAAALGAFGFLPEGRVCLDIGASTGGFTEVLLERGAARVYAVDVGSGQLHDKLRGDPRVVSLEETDARNLTAMRVPEPVSAIVADVSFISLALALPKPLALAAPGCWLVALVKPQFEAGPKAVGKRGLVAPEHRQGAVGKVSSWLSGQPGWRTLPAIPSPIAGKDGNMEFLIGALQDG
jgi:23S rRNA (cytidine1920-2'-O)/16S rRNA (cytidine1409-2'-O)-methyltransferase